jgi:hypothetical protein
MPTARIARAGTHRCWKIVEVKGDRILTLFHGNFGSRILPHGCWLEAQEKPNVSDGVGQRYLSGWHVFKDFEVATKYLRKFKKKRHIIPCYAEELRPKLSSRGNVFLAKRIFIE